MVDPHALAEARSLAAHQRIAAWIRQRDPRGDRALAMARSRVAAWIEDRPGPYVEAWAAILSRPDEEIAAQLEADDEDARARRQSTPFAGALDPRERWALWAQVRARYTG